MTKFFILLLLSVTFAEANSTNAGTLRGSGSRSRLESRLESEIPCEDSKITVEFMTDTYPKDNYWSLTDIRSLEDNETVFKSNPEGYTEKDTLYKKEFCLPDGTYELLVHDTSGDGVCCVEGDGYYRVLDKCGQVILDSKMDSERFNEQSHFFEVHSNDRDDICSTISTEVPSSTGTFASTISTSSTSTSTEVPSSIPSSISSTSGTTHSTFSSSITSTDDDSVETEPPSSSLSTSGTTSSTFSSSIISTDDDSIETVPPSSSLSTSSTFSSSIISTDDDSIETVPPSSSLSTSSTFSSSVISTDDDSIETVPPSSSSSISGTTSGTFYSTSMTSVFETEGPTPLISVDDDSNDDVIETQPPTGLSSTSSTFSTSAFATTVTFSGSSVTSAIGTSNGSGSAAPSESPSATETPSGISSTSSTFSTSAFPTTVTFSGSSSTTTTETSNGSAAPSESPSATGSSSTTAAETWDKTTNSCRDEMNEDEAFRWKKNNGRSLTCQTWARRNYCDTEILNSDKDNKGRYIREVCRKSCDACDTPSASIGPSETPTESPSATGSSSPTATETSSRSAAPSESPSATGSSSPTAAETNGSAAPSESPSATGSSSTTAAETNGSPAPSESPSATGSSSTTADETWDETTNSCKDEMNKDEAFRWKKNNGRSLTCQTWAQRNYCDTEILNNDKNNKGRFIREVCQKSCDACDTPSASIGPSEAPTVSVSAADEAACANSSDPFVDNKGELTTCDAIDALDEKKKEKKCNKAVVIKNCRGICDEECQE